MILFCVTLIALKLLIHKNLIFGCASMAITMNAIAILQNGMRLDSLKITTMVSRKSEKDFGIC